MRWKPVGGAHYWGQEAHEAGHEVRLIRPICVKPFVRRQTNDAAEAGAIVEAALRPTKRGSRCDCPIQPLCTGRSAQIRPRPEDENWLSSVLARRPAKVAAVAMANKTATIIWKVLASDRLYQPERNKALLRVNVI
jgi:transposase